MYPFPTYVYPDGTKSVRKPGDGELFHVTKNNSIDSIWQYDDLMTKWVNITRGKPPVANNSSPKPFGYGYIYPPNDHDEEPAFDHYVNPWEIKCECGAEKVGHPGHSHWCKKYTGKP